MLSFKDLALGAHFYCENSSHGVKVIRKLMKIPEITIIHPWKMDANAIDTADGSLCYIKRDDGIVPAVKL